MRCWNEVCAVSGLPIQEGDQCFMLEFDDVPSMRIKEYKDVVEHLRNIEFGEYQRGGLQNNPGGIVPDTRCFILEYFWNLASERGLNDIEAVEYVQEYTIRFNAAKEFAEKLCWKIDKCEKFTPGVSLYSRNPELFDNFIFVSFFMKSLRRNFYTAGSRYFDALSTQNDWEVIRCVNIAAFNYIDSKFPQH